MSRVVWVLLGTVVAVDAGLPECSSDRQQCYYTVTPAFGDAFKLMFHGVTHLIKESESLHSALCNRENWYRKETGCDAECPLKFEITSPAHRRLTACAYDNAFVPFVPTAHLDMKHPYNGKEFDLVVHGSPGNPDRMGCDPKSFEGKNYTGKIVVVERGACAFSTKFQNLAPTGAAMGLLINTRISNTLDLAIFPMGGSSGGFENLPAMMVATHYRNLITEAYDAGEALKGSFRLSCNSGKPIAEDEDYVMDGCPHFLLTRGLCATRWRDEDRFCARCPVEIEIPGGKPACMFGNGLIPRRAENNFFTALTLPTKESIVYLDLSNGTGCTVEEYLPHKGRIVAVFLPSECLAFHAMQVAAKAGVRGFIIVQPSGNYYPTFIEGTSTGVSIPIGVIAPWDSTRFQDYMKTQRPIRGGFDSGTALTFQQGVMPPTVNTRTEAPTFAPVKLVVEEDKRALEATPPLVISVVFIVMLLAAIGVVLSKRDTKTRKLHSSRTHFTLPLGMVSTGLSLTMLVAITVTAFLLAYNAGQQAVDKAMSNGRSAVGQVHENAVENMADISSKLLNTVTGSTIQMLSAYLTEGHTAGMFLRRIFQNSDGTWEWFDRHFDTVVQVNKQTPWAVKVLTTEGFYADEYQKTDDRPDSERNDGQRGVSVTNNGHLYGWQRYSYDQRTWTTSPNGVIPRGWYDPFKMIGGFYGSPFELVKELPDFSQHWVVNEYSLPIPFLGHGTAPLATITPMSNGSKIFTGAILSERPIDQMARLLIKEQTGEIFENVTIFVVDGKKGLLASSTLGTPHKKFHGIPWDSGYTFVHKLYTVEEVKYPQINAAANYIRKHFGGLNNKTYPKGSGEFDQRDYYKGYSSLLMRFTFEGSLEDVSGNRWKSETRGGACEGRCFGEGREGQGLVFDGKTVLHIYSNLTTDVAHVEGTRLGSGAWQSSFPIYNTTGRLPDGSEAVFWEGKPMLREPFHFEDVSISVWIRHSESVDMTPGAESGRIYSDTVIGEAALRWYANGMFFLLRMSYGCRTGPVLSLRKGEWAHMTAVVNWEKRYCAVYVNGVLHDKSLMSVEVNLLFSPTAHLIGQYFKGEMDDLQVYNRSLDDEAVEELYSVGTVSKVPSRRWYMEFGTEDAANPRTALVVVAMVPVEDVRRNVDANNALTRRNLRVEEENTQQDLDQITADNAFILVVVALFAMFLFLLFNNMITAPFTSFARLMIDVAVMRVEAIQPQKYVVRELNTMDEAMVLMARNLKEYKSFMPQSVMMNDEESEEEDEDAPLLSQSSLPRDRGSSRGQSSRGGTSKSSASRNSLVMAAKMMVIGLSRKKVTLVACNIVGFHRLADAVSDAELTTVHGMVISHLLTCAERGNAGPFSGDRMLVSFNTTRPAASHRTSGCNFICRAQREIPGLPEKLQLNFAGVSGDAKVGNMGSDMMKQYSIVGSVVSWAFALERQCRLLDLPNLVDMVLADAARNEFFLYHADILLFRKRHESRPLRVSVVKGLASISNDEWMYQLEEAQRKDPFSMWNEAFNSAIGLDYQDALRKMEMVPTELIPPAVLAKLQHRIAGKDMSPTEII